MIYYKPAEHELEAASNSYLMSLLAVMAGLPFPIINLLATAVFYLANRHRTYFVRWHCTQALVSQLPLFCTNSVLFWWTFAFWRCGTYFFLFRLPVYRCTF